MKLSPPLKRFIVAVLSAGLVAAVAVGSNTTEATEPLTFILVVAAAFAAGAIDYARKHWQEIVNAAGDGGAALAGASAVAAVLFLLAAQYGGVARQTGVEQPGDVEIKTIVPFAPGDPDFDVGDWCRTNARRVYVDLPAAEVNGVIRIAWRSDLEYVRWVDNGRDTAATRYFVWSKDPMPPAGKKAGDADSQTVQVLDADDVTCMRSAR